MQDSIIQPNTVVNNIDLFVELLREGDNWFGASLDPFTFNDAQYDGPRSDIPSRYAMFDVQTLFEAESFIHNICEQSNITDNSSLVNITEIAQSFYDKFISNSSPINNPGNVN